MQQLRQALLAERSSILHGNGAFPQLSASACVQVSKSSQTTLLTALLEGPPGTGKTALAATVGLGSQFPFVKVISADNMVGFSETAKSSHIAKVFDDAYRVSLHSLSLQLMKLQSRSLWPHHQTYTILWEERLHFVHLIFCMCHSFGIICCRFDFETRPSFPVLKQRALARVDHMQSCGR